MRELKAEPMTCAYHWFTIFGALVLSLGGTFLFGEAIVKQWATLSAPVLYGVVALLLSLWLWAGAFWLSPRRMEVNAEKVIAIYFVRTPKEWPVSALRRTAPRSLLSRLFLAEEFVDDNDVFQFRMWKEMRGSDRVLERFPLG